MASLNEDTLELATVDYFCALGYQYAHGPEIAPDGGAPERDNYGQIVLVGRLRNALGRINPDVPEEAIEEALRKVTPTRQPIAHRQQPRLPPDAHRRRGRVVARRRS